MPGAGNTATKKVDEICPPGTYNPGGKADTWHYLFPTSSVSEQRDKRILLN